MTDLIVLSCAIIPVTIRYMASHLPPEIRMHIMEMHQTRHGVRSMIVTYRGLSKQITGEVDYILKQGLTSGSYPLEVVAGIYDNIPELRKYITVEALGIPQELYERVRYGGHISRIWDDDSHIHNHKGPYPDTYPEDEINVMWEGHYLEPVPVEYLYLGHRYSTLGLCLAYIFLETPDEVNMSIENTEYGLEMDVSRQHGGVIIRHIHMDRRCGGYPDRRVYYSSRTLIDVAKWLSRLSQDDDEKVK
jgi:hypothetical protein